MARVTSEQSLDAVGRLLQVQYHRAFGPPPNTDYALEHMLQGRAAQSLPALNNPAVGALGAQRAIEG
jgi:hypothetical protein